MEKISPDARRIEVTMRKRRDFEKLADQLDPGAEGLALELREVWREAIRAVFELESISFSGVMTARARLQAALGNWRGSSQLLDRTLLAVIELFGTVEGEANNASHYGISDGSVGN